MIYSVIPHEIIFADNTVSSTEIKQWKGSYFEMDSNGARRLLSTNPKDFLKYETLPNLTDMDKS